jgi:hypothetical protein
MPHTAWCPLHGFRRIVALGATGCTLSCGATGCTEDGFTHPGWPRLALTAQPWRW